MPISLFAFVPKWTVLIFVMCFNFSSFSQENSVKLLTKIFNKIDFYSETENYDTVLVLYQKALSLAKKHDDKKLILSELGYTFALLENYERGAEYFKKALNFAMENTPKDASYISDQYYYIAYNYYELDNLNQALENYKKSLDYGSIKEYGISYAQTLSSIAGIYLKKSDYDNALIYEKKALDIFESKEELLQAIQSNNSLALFYYFKQDYQRALPIIQSVISFYENTKEAASPKSQISTLINYALILIKLKKFDEAKACFIKIAQLQNSTKKEYLREIVEFNQAFFEYETQNFQQALIDFEKTLKLYHKKFPKGHTNIGKAYYYIGQIQTKKQQYEFALQSYQKALRVLIPNFKNEDPLVNPELTQYCRSHRNLLRILTAKAKVLGIIYFSDNHKKRINETLIFDTYNLAIKVSENLRQSYKTEGSRYFLAEETEELFGQAVEFSYQLYTQTGEQKYLEKAHFYVEKNQSPILLQRHRAIEGQAIGGVPLSLIKSEKQLSIDLAFYKNEQSLALEKKDKKKAQLYGDYVFSCKQQLDSLQENLKLNYPRYFEHQYGSKTIPLASLQQKLSNQQLLLQYYLSEEGIYAFAFTKQSADFMKIKDATAIKILTHDFLEALKNPLTKKLSKEVAFEQLTISSHQLYQELVAPLLKKNLIQPTRLVIIANGFLTEIPFEVLLSKPRKKEQANYLNLDYLVHNFAISYQPSASLMQRLQIPKKTRASKEILAIAPFVETTENLAASLRGALGNLPYSKDEVENLSSLFETNILLKNEAQKATFLATAADYRILHLATHGAANFENPSHSALYFHPSDSKDSTAHILFNYEIQNLQLNADLAVLSACETGAGKVDKGEGILSLARGFFYTGIQSLFMSKWQINDYSSSLIVNELYERLKENHPKDKALQIAKISYLQNEADLVTAHPFYWAGLVQLGNTKALNFQATNWWFWGGLFVFLLLLIVFLKKYFG